MKHIIITVIILLTTGILIAQQKPQAPVPPVSPSQTQLPQSGDESRRDKHSEIESYRVAFLTSRLDLSPEESQVFWPLYNQYQKELKALREQMNVERPSEDVSTLSDAEANKKIEMIFSYKQKEVDIQKAYVDKMKGELPSWKIVKLFALESRFKRDMLESVKSRLDDRPRHKRE